MLDILKAELDKHRALDGELPPILKQIVDANPNPKIPYRMKLTIAVSELVLFASHLRRNILHWNGSSIPINAISFAIAGSGDGKDSAVSAARKCFKTGYSILETKRKDLAKVRAQQAARADGKENADEWDTYKEYYHTPNPLFVAPSTAEGFIQHLNDLDSAGIGAGYTQSGEFGAELVSGGLIVENIKLLSEIYDEGNKEVKVLKARENQSKEIKSLPVSALYMGSQDNLLYDDTIKKVFRREFSTKLARRSYFMFFPETIKPLSFTSEPNPAQALLTYKRKLEDDAVAARAVVDGIVSEIAKEAVKGAGKPLAISEEVRDLFTLYEAYNDEMADTIKAQYPISKLVRKHLQWKALKLAGAIAIFSGRTQVTKSDYISAISYGEMLNDDMQKFELELVKEPYEVFVDFMHKTAIDGKSQLGLHTLRKLGYIATTGIAHNKMKELVVLAASYDKTGVYTVCEEGICYEEVQLTDVAGVSYLEVDNSEVMRAIANNLGKEKISRAKQQVAGTAANGYEFYETDFAELGEMLEEDLAYSPFRFMTKEEGAKYDEEKQPNATGGIRGRDNIIGGCKWIYLDIDDSTITDEEAHFMLQDINHHIARTSNADNEFKFRVLIELDGIADIPDIQWPHFIKSISDSLSLKADKLPKSQIAFAYAGRNVLSVTDAEPLAIKEHIMSATTTEPRTEAKKPTTAQAKALLDDELTTFRFAFEAESGEGSRMMIRAAKWAFKDLGATTEETIDLMHRINQHWEATTGDPMPEDRLEATIISQIKRM